MYNRRYDKAFVMLKQETNGFSLGNKPAWGSAVMEIKNGKGRVSLTVQEMKPLPEGRDYVLYVIGGERGTAIGICCGKFKVDNYGRGELKWEFNPDDIEDSKQTAEHLHTVAILVEGKDNYGLVAPVAGYFGDTVNWKKRFKAFHQTPENNMPLDEAPAEALKADEALQSDKVTVELPEAKNIDEEAEVDSLLPTDLSAIPASLENEVDEPAILGDLENFAVMQPAQENDVESTKETTYSNEADELGLAACETAIIPKASNFHDNFKDMMTRFHKELKELEEIGVLTPDDRKRIDAAGNPPVEKKKGMELQIEFICANNTAISPFDMDDRQWRCISMEELAVLPVEFISMMRNPFYILPYRKYKHFIFGWDEKGSCYLGIPDIYRAQNKRLAESLGFQDFTSCSKDVKGEECKGYWIKDISK